MVDFSFLSIPGSHHTLVVEDFDIDMNHVGSLFLETILQIADLQLQFPASRVRNEIVRKRRLLYFSRKRRARHRLYFLHSFRYLEFRGFLQSVKSIRRITQSFQPLSISFFYITIKEYIILKI